MPEQETATPTPSFLEQIAAARQAQAAPVAEAAPAPAKEVAAPVAEAPAKPTEPEKPKVEAEEPAKSPIEEIEEIKGDETEFRLPIEEEEADPAEAPAKEGDDAEDKTPAGRRFAELKNELKEHKRQLAERDAKLAQYESKTKESEGVTSELEALRQKVSDYEAEFSVVKLEKTEAFQQHVAAPLKEIFTASDKIAERYNIDPDQLAVAMEIADEDQRESALLELTSGIEVTPGDQYKMRALADKLQPVIEKRKDLYANADQALAQLNARREQEASADAAAKAEERRKTTAKVVERITEKLPFVKDIPGVNFDNVAKAVGDLDFNALPVHEKAYAQIAGALLPKFVKDRVAMQNQIDSLLDELESYKQAAPNPGGGKPALDSGAPKRFIDLIAEAR